MMAAKRRANVSISSNDCVSSDDDYCTSPPPNKMSRSGRSALRSYRQNASSCDENFQEQKRKPKCNSKNAIMARENRIKKKMYVNSLESKITSLKGENKKIKMALSSQLGYLKELEKEVAYLKSVLANSKEIGALIGTICNSPTLQVKTPLININHDDVQMQTSDKFVKRRPPIARKTAWPYENEFIDSNIGETENGMITPGTSVSSLSPPYEDESPFSPLDINMDSIADVDNFPIMFNDTHLLSPFMSDITEDDFGEKQEELILESTDKNTVNTNCSLDHNYSSKLVDTLPEEDTSDYGICLHISNKKLSLEFCSKCNERAIANWEAVTR